MTTERPDKAIPPHLAFATFISGIETLQEGLPPKLDRSVWPSQSGTAQAQLLRAFRFFGLTDDADDVQPSLRDLVDAKENRKELMRSLVESHYPELVALGKANASLQQLNDAMGRFGVEGDTRRKAITFFLQASSFSELAVSPLWPGVKKRGAAKGRRASGARRPRTRPPGGTDNGTNAKSTGSSKTIDLKSGGRVTLAVSVDVMKLTAADRNFVFEMIDKLSGYETQEPNPASGAVRE